MNLNTPKPFTPQTNRIGKDWQLWKKEFMIFLKLSGAYENLSEENRAYLLMNLMGTEGIKAMENMTFDHPNEKKDMDILIMKFDEIFDPPLNEAAERYKFFSRRKRENETIENFVADLKEKAETCNFGKQTDKMIIDRIICNVDDYLRKIIFALNDVTIPDLIQYYNQYSANTDKIKEITKDLRKAESSDKKPQPRSCWRCNTRHAQRNCPAYGKICNVCNEKNHFSGLCKKESTNSQKMYKKESTNSQKTEIQKMICSKCGTSHPYQPCPADKGTEIPQKRICSKCGTNHPYQQCPAYDYTCFKCRSRGHYENRCKNPPADSTTKDEQIKTNKSTIKQNEQKDLQQCLWCDLKHSQGQCQHNPNCTMCHKFPHNICFNCKKNPHELSCYYKSIITLPALSAKTSNFSSSAHKTSSHTVNGNHENSSNKNSSSSSYCNLCLKVGEHSSENCPRAINNRQSTPSKSTTADPLLKDYVKVNQNTPRSAQYQASTSYQNQTKSTNYYRNNTQFQNNHKKSNPKSDNCCIS